MVFYYLDVLDGGTTSTETARKYQNEMLSDLKFDHHNTYDRTLFHDLIVEGKGAGQLLNVKHCRNEEAILIEALKYNITPKIVKGIFKPTAIGAGEICLFSPMQWENISVHIRYGKTYQNTLNEKLKEHKIESPIGFTILCPHVLSNYTKDNSAGEQIELSNITRELKNKIEKESKPAKQKFKKNNRGKKR